MKCGYKNSFSGYSLINQKDERISIFGKESIVKTFSTKDEADLYIKGMLENAMYYAKN